MAKTFCPFFVPPTPVPRGAPEVRRTFLHCGAQISQKQISEKIETQGTL